MKSSVKIKKSQSKLSETDGNVTDLFLSYWIIVTSQYENTKPESVFTHLNAYNILYVCSVDG